MLGRLVLYRYAAVFMIISWSVLFFLANYKLNILAFAIVTIIWLGVALVALNRIIRKWPGAGFKKYLLLLIYTIMAVTGLVILVESEILRNFVIILGGLLIGFLFALPIHETQSVRHEFKPWRRMVVMLTVFNTYAFITLLYAFSIFFPSSPFWLLGIIAGVLYALAALIIWSLYFDISTRQFFLWALLVGLVMLELVWVFRYLPLGYLVFGFVLTWVWYLIQLFVRFHLGKQDVIWKRQYKFLLINFVMFALVLLFVVRWI